MGIVKCGVVKDNIYTEEASRFASKHILNKMGYEKKYLTKEVGSKKFDMKEVRLAGFAIGSDVKTTLSDNCVNQFISEWVQGDLIEKKQLKGLGEVTKGLVK